MWKVGLRCRPGETIRVDTDGGWVGRRSGGQGEKEEGDGGDVKAGEMMIKRRR